MITQKMVRLIVQHLGIRSDSAFQTAAARVARRNSDTLRKLGSERSSELANSIDRIERHFIGVMSPDIRAILAAAKKWDEHESGRVIRE